jgi:CBS-domain-containing membrane protein
MTGDAECVSVDETLADAARKLRDLDVGALPICGEDNRLKGMLTDRDIVVKCLAEGKDPFSTKVAELADGKPVTIGADDSVEEALQAMKEHGVRRLPVIDGHDLIGIVSQADIARKLPEDKDRRPGRGHLLSAVEQLTCRRTQPGQRLPVGGGTCRTTPFLLQTQGVGYVRPEPSQPCSSPQWNRRKPPLV